jgi:hypothetical protein
MLIDQTALLCYYLGFGFVACLAWVGLGFEATTKGSEQGPRRWLRRTGRACLILGVLHPVVALTGRDVLRQLQLADQPELRPKPSRLADVVVIVSLLMAAVICTAVLNVD